MWAIPTGTSSALKKKSGKESQYMVSHPELGWDPPIGSDRETGRDRNYHFTLFRKFEVSRVLHSPLLKKNFVPKFCTITTTHMHMQRAL